MTAQAMRQLRENKGISQERLALESGTGRSYMSRLELGKQAPTVPLLMHLLEHLDFTLAEFEQEYYRQLRRARRNKRS